MESQVPAEGPRTSTSLFSGTGVLFVSRLIVAAIGWVGTILIVRSLSGEEWGAFSLIFNVLGLLGLIADFQTSRIVVREVLEAGDDLDELVGSFVTFRVALGAVMYFLAIAFVVVSGYERSIVEGVMLGGLSFFISTAAWALITVCQARLWLRTIAISMVVGQVVQFILIVALFVNHSDSMLRFIVPFVIFDIVTLVWMLVALRKIVRVRPHIQLERWWHWMKDAAPLAVGSTLGTAYFRIDGIMLSKLGDVTSVGVYQIGYKFSDLLAFMAPALLGAVLPQLIRAWPGHSTDFHRTFRQAFIIFLAFATFATVTFGVLCGPTIQTLYGSEYASAEGPARLLVVGQGINLFTQLAFVMLVAAHRRRLYPIATLVGLIVNVTLNFVLIPRYLATGAGIATIITEVIVLGILAYAVHDLPIKPLPWRSIAVITASGCLLFGALVAMSTVVPWPVALAAAIVLFPGLLHLMRLDGPGGLVAFARWSRFTES